MQILINSEVQPEFLYLQQDPRFHWCCLLRNILNAKVPNYIPRTQDLRNNSPNVFETSQDTSGFLR